ncbi:beta-ketoacyl synthase N-terminal-like domain-containing protein [Amycolatopsis sp. NPDC051128]|uniref:beta-ketoacyl synthase N-terminal-like domain-containing protein n=1 Tax=Amycolatopsis sp. NPDC051128 TaxID=3155412 RepID=UPI0034304E37
MTAVLELDGTRPATAVADITGCGVLSAAGPGLAALRGTGWRSPLPRTASDEPDWPPLAVAPVAGFDPAETLGSRGIARLSRSEQLAMAACLAALDATREGPGADRTGIVLGTSMGSARAVLDLLRDTFQQARPYLVNPSGFPSTMMVSAAGRAAIRTGLTGVNATVSGGPVAGLHAVRYAAQALRNGHADRMLAGAVEELSPEAAWAWHHGNALAADTPLAEGCAVFTLDAPGTAAGRRLGRILACETAFTADGPAAVSALLARTVRTALARAGVTAADVTTVVPGARGRRGWAAVEERALRAVFGAGAPPCLEIAGTVGEAHAAGAALQLAAALANPGPDGGLALLTSVGTDGSAGCLVVDLPASPGEVP